MDTIVSKIDYNASLSAEDVLNAMMKLKAANCKITGPSHPNSIYKHLETSNIIYEELVLYNQCKAKNTVKTSFEVKRQYIKNKYYVTDTLFPLFRGLYCLRDTFSGSSSIKVVNQHEISLYKESIKLIYFMGGSIKKYKEEEVRSLYSDFEYNIILPELITGVIKGLITPEEEVLLMDLLRRDKEVSIFLDKLLELCKYSNSIEITPIIPDFAPIIVWNPTPISLLREYMSMGFSMLFIQVFNRAKKLTSDLNMRSISDFRMIFELGVQYDKCVFEVNFNNSPLGSTTFRFESEDSTNLVPKYFKR